jgi:hypothetical protein
VTPEQLIEHCPRLYHLTHADNLEAIQRHGLWSTSALLDRCGVVGAEREALEARRRPTSVTLVHSAGGTVTLRDQGPLSEKRLAAVLTGGIDVTDWLRLINARVFFFPDEKRWRHLADVYADERQAVLVLNTDQVVARYLERIELAHMNTGATAYVPQPRGRDTFKRLADYPYDERRRKYGRSDALKEITVLGGIESLEGVLHDIHLAT